jgi:hypothetical protein
VSLGAYLAGWVLFCLSLGFAAGAARIVVRSRYDWMAPEARAVAYVLLTAGALFAAHLLPLALGVLTRATALAAALLVLLAATRVRPAGARAPEPPSGRPGDRPARAVAAVVAGLAGAYALAFLFTNRAVAIGDVDATGFHLPVIADWLRTGSLWQFTDYSPGWAFGAYPHSGNVLQTAVILPWHHDFLLRLVGTTCLLATGLAVYALGAELGAPRPLALVAAVMAAMVPTATIVGLDHGQTDLVAAAGFASAALFAVRHARTGERSELVLVALGLGLAFGTKWYAPPQAAALLALWTGARVVASRRDWQPVVAEGVAVGVSVLVIGGIWMLRNLVLSGDPVFPRPVSILGVTLFEGTPFKAEPFDFAVVHYLGDLLGDGIRSQLERSFGAPGGLIVLGTLVAAVVAWRARERRVLVLALGSLLALAVYVVTPFTAQGPEGQPGLAAGVRYALPALMLGAGVCAWLLGRAGRAAIGLGALVLAAQVQAIVSNRDAGGAFRDTTTARILAGVLAVGVLAAAGRALLRRRPPARAVLAGVAVLALVTVAAGRRVQTQFDAARYRIGPVYTWLQTVPSRPIRIGLVGDMGDSRGNGAQIVSYGPRMRNHASYVGVRREHLLQDHPTQAALAAALRRGGYDVLLTGPSPHALPWAKAAGWRPFLDDGRFTLLAPPQR